jgi:hypothetical protein
MRALGSPAAFEIAGARGPDGVSIRIKGRGSSAMSRIVGAVLFRHPAYSGRYSRHLSFHPMNRSGSDAECLSRLEDSRAGRQLRPDALNYIGAHRATPEPLPLTPRSRKTRFDPLDNHRALELGKACTTTITRSTMSGSPRRSRPRCASSSSSS